MITKTSSGWFFFVFNGLDDYILEKIMRTNVLDTSAVALSQLRYATLLASENISNADNQYYSRNTVVFGNNSSGLLSASSLRMNNFFLTSQLHSANADGGYASSYLNFASTVDSIITGITADSDGNSTNVLLNGIDNIASSFQDLATNDTNSGRQTLLSRISALVSNANSIQSTLQEYSDQINSELKVNAETLNTQANQIAQLNKKIALSPDDSSLLTERDTILGSMSKLISIDVTEKDNGTVDVRLNNGVSIVKGIKSSEISTSNGLYGSDLQLSINGNIITKPSIIGGEIGGSLAAREEIIGESERGTAKALLGYLASINATNKNGFTSDGTAGTDLITIGTVNSLANSKNTGTGNFTVTLDDTKISSLSAGPIEIEKTASGYLLTDTQSGETVTSVTSPISGFGYTFEATGTMVSGDKFIADPLAQMLKNVSVTDDTSAIAAASSTPVASGDTSNLTSLAYVSETDIFNGGSDSIYDELSSVFVSIGNKHVTADQNSTTAQSIIDNAEARWANLSGVNTTEEELNLVKFQQIYQSISKVIEGDTKMFDSLINVI